MSTIIKIVGQITLKALTDVESTTYYYLLQSSMAPAPNKPTTNPPTGGWSTTEPEFFIYTPTQDTTIVSGKDYYIRSGTEGSYVYTKVLEPSVSSLSSYYEKIYGDTRSLYVTVQTLYTDSTFEYSEPSLSSSYEAAKEAYNRAKTALDLAGDTNQYFWTLSSTYSTDIPAGVYVTHIPQSQFKLNPAQGNILMQNTGLTIRNGTVALASLTNDALNFYSPATHNSAMQLSGQALNFYRPSDDRLALTLNNSGLNFYGSSIVNPDATLTVTGLVLNKGGIKAGDDGQNGFIYLSTEDYQLKDATHNGITINGHTPTANGVDGKTADDPAWREIIGTKFGVDSDGNLYANNAHLSEAHVDGDIVAQSLTIGSGGGAYDGAAAINISGYTIEITIDSTGVIDAETTTYLYPHLYHNGIEVTTGIDYSHFIWYRNDDSIGTEGDANNQGRYLATYGDSYRVVYDFDDGAVGGGTEVQTRTVDPSKYITRINDTGITIHPEVWNNESSYIQLDGTGMELFDSNKVSIAQYGTTTRIGFVNGKNIYLDNNGMQIRSGSTSLASFGTTAQIGQNGNSRFLMNTDSLQAYNSNNQKYFEVNENGLSWGNNTAATTSQVDMAAQTATNFISYDSTNGLQLASSLPLTATRKLQILNDAIKVQNDNSNYLNINGDGMQIWANSKKIADFGSDVILGDSNEAHSIFKSSALEFYTNTTNKIVSINNDGTFKVYDNDFPVMTVGNFNNSQGILLDCIDLNKTGGHLFGIGSSGSSDTENFASHVTLRSYAESSSTNTGYSEAYLQLEAMSNRGLNYHYIHIDAVKDGWSGIESSVAITVNSDERLKENCIPVNNISNLLFEIKPIVYSWKDKRTEQRYFGFKAQEVKAALERVVENVEEYAIIGKNRDGYYNLSYMELIPLIVDIIQKMNERIIKLENKKEE